jgi:hypothetical protein
VQRSSESVAALASALAKAQAELVNPEKSLTATIRTSVAGERERTFRYAPLSSGLDIVRKTLGQHEIATIQTTAVDHTSGLVNLTTVLAHASGEWIASDWPVCSIAEMASPHRMGTALTYARRYALFTLVGIAGEDDIDAPDIACGPMPSNEVEGWRRRSPAPARDPGNGRLRGGTKNNLAEVLDADQSAALRDTLTAEVATLESAEVAVGWAARILPVKNSLTAADAKLLEEAFEQKLSALSSHLGPEAFTLERAAAEEASPEQAKTSPEQAKMHPQPAEASPEEQTQVSGAETVNPGGIDKSILAVAAPRRYRNREHLRYVAQHACLVCGRKPSDPHHLRYMQPRALGRKASDEFAVPLCRAHHRAVHRAGDERAWWRAVDIDPLKVARLLWKDTRVNEGRMRPDRIAQCTDTNRPANTGEGDTKPPA